MRVVIFIKLPTVLKRQPLPELGAYQSARVSATLRPQFSPVDEVHIRRFSLVSELVIDNMVTGDPGNLFAFPPSQELYYAKTDKTSNISVTILLEYGHGLVNGNTRKQRLL
jgi:hypothetical protein